MSLSASQAAHRRHDQAVATYITRHARRLDLDDEPTAMRCLLINDDVYPPLLKAPHSSRAPQLRPLPTELFNAGEFGPLEAYSGEAGGGMVIDVFPRPSTCEIYILAQRHTVDRGENVGQVPYPHAS